MAINCPEGVFGADFSRVFFEGSFRACLVGTLPGRPFIESCLAGALPGRPSVESRLAGALPDCLSME